MFFFPLYTTNLVGILVSDHTVAMDEPDLRRAIFSAQIPASLEDNHDGRSRNEDAWTPQSPKLGKIEVNL